MDRLEYGGHCFDFAARDHREDILVDMDGAALILGFWKHRVYGIQLAQVLVANE
jgi:hypothetical protein